MTHQTIPFEEYRRDSALAEVLIDPDTVPIRMRKDYLRRNANVEAHATLCARCDGTGNELYASYRACPACAGTGKS